jgi:tetratricopeptide (TPR) repeat protein
MEEQGRVLKAGSPRPAVRWLAVALLLVSPMVLLVGMELALRVAGYGYPTSFFVASSRPEVLITNRQYGWRFFPRRIARTPLPMAIAKEPRPGRILVLGESAAMGFPDPMFSFAHQLQALRGGAAVEVINTSMTAINSNVIREIAAESMRLRPELVVIYMGNNEVVGPAGAALRLRHLRLGQLLSPQRENVSQWRGMEMFLDRQMAVDDPRLQSIHDNFRENLRGICRAALASGARVVLSTVAVNLKDNPPFAGEAAQQAFAAGDFAKARDLDTLRFRADTRINAIIREVAAGFPGVRLVDAEKLISPDARSFYEHVHLRPEANLQLARAVLESSEGTPLEPTAWDRHRMLRDIIAMMSRPPFRGAAALMPELAELRGRVDLKEAEAAYRAWSARFPDDLLVRERYAELLGEMGKNNEAAAQWRYLIGQIPEVPHWHTGLAEALLGGGKLEEAKQAYEQALRVDPRFLAAPIGLGTIAYMQGQQAEAEARFREALAMDASSAEANNNLAGLLVRQNKLAEAVPYFAEAVRVKPEFANAQYSYAATLARLQKRDEAITHYRAALDANPDFAAAHYDLGLLLAEQGKFEEAIGHYREALRQDPGNADAENNWGTALARQGRIREALPHFEAALRLQPGHVQAAKNLASARAGGR